MALWAEWDPTTNNVVQIKNDDPQPGQHGSGFTGANRTTGAKTTWYPLSVDYPEDYVPRFPHLLGPGIMTLEEGTVHHRFPQADFSERAVRGALVDEVKRTTGQALAQSDWYVIRKFETGEPIPDEVKIERLQIRAQGKAQQQAARAAAPSDLLDFDTSVKIEGRSWATLAPSGAGVTGGAG